MIFLNLLILLIELLLVHCEENTDIENWTGLWFPHKPNIATDATINRDAINGEQIFNYNHTHPHNIPMGVLDLACDNAKDNIAIDFDPNNKFHQLLYLCLDNKTEYRPSYDTQPIQRKYLIPKAYVPLHKCLNESITYSERLPTFGNHRPNWAKYGEYKYLPEQRWLHNLEHGAIVFLYHPCANQQEINKIRNIVKGCLHRYIVTPSQRLSSKRPLALLAWGTSLELSVVDEKILIDFIKLNALKGPENLSRDGQYDELLIDNAKIVSDENDGNLCSKL